jgi:hypothetical protein
MAGDNRYEWGNRAKRKGGYISLDADVNGLPILQINVDDDYYAGEVSHKDLFRLITAIAEEGINRKKEKMGLVLNTKENIMASVVERTMAPFHSMKTPFHSIPLLYAPTLGFKVYLHETQKDIVFQSDDGSEVELGKGACFFTEGVDFLEYIGMEIGYQGIDKS